MTQPLSRQGQQGAVPVTIVVAVAAVVLGLIVTMNALSAYRTDVAQRGWDEVFGTWDEIMQRYPATQVNASALELERLAARLGVNITPRNAERREALENEQIATIDPELQATFYNYGKTQMERARHGEIDAPPPDFQSYITANDEDLIALRRHLNRGDTPVWLADISWIQAAPIPNLLGHIHLQKLLTSVALARLQAGDRTGAVADVEAAWELSRSLRDSPFLISQLILVAGTRMQVGVLRHFHDLDEVWLDRLAEHDFRESFITAMKFEGRFWLRYPEAEYWRNEEPVWRRVTSPVMQPYTQLCLADLSDEWRERLVKMEQVDALCDRDLAPYGASLDIQLPRWNMVGDYYFPSLLGAIDRLARLELDIELTSLLIEADAERRDHGGTWPESDLVVRPSIDRKSVV